MNKYRAWDKEKKEMYEVTCIDFIKKMVCVLETVSIVPHRWIPFKKAVLMQSTGLKDKNGVEIFEADVLRITGGTFYHGYWQIDKKITVNNLWDLYMPWFNDEEFEIFGNIHENPELLK